MNVEKHLLRGRRHNFQRSITDTPNRRRHQRRVVRNDRLHHAHRIFTRRAPRVAGAVIMVVSKQPAGLTVARNSGRPTHGIVASIRIRDDRTLADVFPDLSAVATRIQGCDDAAAVWSNPVTYVEWNSARRFLNRSSAAGGRAGVPRQLLRRESSQTCVREYAGQRCGKSKTVRQHVLDARLAKLTLKKLVTVKYLAKDRLR